MSIAKDSGSIVAQVLRVLRATRKSVGAHSRAGEALRAAIEAVRRLEIPHMERLDETFDDTIIH